MQVSMKLNAVQDATVLITGGLRMFVRRMRESASKVLDDEVRSVSEVII